MSEGTHIGVKRIHLICNTVAGPMPEHDDHLSCITQYLPCLPSIYAILPCHIIPLFTHWSDGQDEDPENSELKSVDTVTELKESQRGDQGNRCLLEESSKLVIRLSPRSQKVR